MNFMWAVYICQIISKINEIWKVNLGVDTQILLKFNVAIKVILYSYIFVAYFMYTCSNVNDIFYHSHIHLKEIRIEKIPHIEFSNPLFTSSDCTHNLPENNTKSNLLPMLHNSTMASMHTAFWL